MPSYDWQWQRGPELDATTLYDLLALREAVFVVEQRCAYQELDGRDLLASTHHLRVLGEDGLAATLRLLKPDTDKAAISIGRVVVHAEHRGHGLGHELLRAALARIASCWPGYDARLAAQAHLQDYYRQHGFEPLGEVYVEDGLPHIDMHRASDHEKA